MIIRTTPVAASVPFDNDTNGYAAEDVQAAIEESKITAVALPRYAIVTTFNGTVSNNQWLGYSNLLPGDSVPIIIPSNAVLKEISFSNVRNNVNGDLVLYRNGTAAGDIITSIPVDNIRSGVFLVNLSFQTGDALRGRWVETGTNPNDLSLVYFFQIEE